MGPLLFNVFINDIFLVIDSEVNLINYADDNTLIYAHKDEKVLKHLLEKTSDICIKWFKLNKMKVNPSKFQSMHLKRDNNKTITFNIDNKELVPTSKVKLLGVTDKLDFNFHIDVICKKASKQINALRRVSRLLDSDTKLLIFNSFVSSVFNYCPVVYTNFSVKNACKLEKLHERALRFVYDDFSAPYETILQRAKKQHLFISHIHRIIEQVHKIITNNAPPISESFFYKM